MTERIYIDGVLMEQSGDKNASLVFQSPLFTEIDSIVGNRSNSVDFPPTDANLKALGLSHLDRSGSKYANKKHDAQYYLDGVQVFNGTAILQSITPTALKFSFTWGNATAFQKLLDIKLQSLQTDAAGDYVTYTQAGIRAAGREADVDCGSAVRAIPLMTAVEILNRMASVSGVTIDTTPFAALRIPLLTATADLAAKSAQGLILSVGDFFTILPTGYWPTITIAKTAYDSDLAGLHESNGIYNVENVNTLRVAVAKGTRYKCKYPYDQYTNSWVKQQAHLAIYACDEDGDNLVKIADLTGHTTTSSTSGGNYYIETRYTKKVTTDIDVSQYSYLRLVAGLYGSTGHLSSTYSLIDGSIRMYADPNDDAKVVNGGKLPLWLNLPDWTGSQFLKNLMKMLGLFPSCPNDTTINFVSVQAIYDNRARAMDWTNRIDLENEQPQERTTALSGYAKNNRFKYAADESVKGNYDGNMTINDDTLPDETELVSLDFAGTDEQFNKPVIPVWDLDDSQHWVQVGDQLTPRILWVNSANELRFKGLEWDNLLASYYSAYAMVVSRPRIVKAKVIVSAAELATLDLAVPVYSYGLGRFFAISKLTTAGDGTAVVELMRLGEGGEALTSLRYPTYAAPTQDLAVMYDDANNEWYTKITSLSDDENNDIATMQTYRIVMERWGYARRGKPFKYINKYGEEQTTHATRRGRTRGVGETEQYYAYDANGNYLGVGASLVPDGGWVWGVWGGRKYTYKSATKTWTEASEGHLFKDGSGTKGNALPTNTTGGGSSYYSNFECTRNLGGYTKKWRQIGWDILIHGSKPTHSQTFQRTRYDNATLVCALGDALVLPALQSNSKYWYGKKHRYHNRARNGLMELAVSLWHYEGNNGGWVRVSNRVRVRSRNEDCTTYWEFDVGNEQ